MWPMLTGLITGGASLLGSIFSSNTSASNQAQQIQAQQQMQTQSEEFNASQAQLNRDFQSQMSNTAYQRASQDMQKAGLNPAAMFGSGSAASSPSGSTASIGTPTVPVSQAKGTLSGLGDAVAKGLDAAVSAKSFERMTQEIANMKTEGVKKAAEVATELKRPDLIQAETSNVQQDTTAKKLDRARQEWEAIKYLDLSQIPDVARKAGNIGSWGAGKVGDIAAPIVSSALGVRKFMPNVYVREGSRSYAPDGKSFDEFWKSRTGFSN